MITTKTQYSTKYTDIHGTERTTIHNDGTILQMSLRGVLFESTEFDSFEPLPGVVENRLTQFTLNRGKLCNCRIECQIPLPIANNTLTGNGALFVRLELGNPSEKGGLDMENLHLILEYQNQRISSSGTSGWFEDELEDIQKQLPEQVYMKACINCMFSDYSPAGHGLFGCMLCYRTVKEEYLQVCTKQDFLKIHDRYERSVQETFLCPDFQRRKPGIGYRG